MPAQLGDQSDDEVPDLLANWEDFPPTEQIPEVPGGSDGPAASVWHQGLPVDSAPDAPAVQVDPASQP